MPHIIHPWNNIKSGYVNGTLLLGNGASMAISDKFSYSSLYKKAAATDLLSADVQQIFNYFQTRDFELILRLVWHASKVNDSLGIPDDLTKQAYSNVRQSLIEAIQNVHPTFTEISPHLPQMHDFLTSFNTILSLNYDLLVYWVIAFGLQLGHARACKDCFVYGSFDDDWKKFRNPFRKENSRTLVFYPHGNLALARMIDDSEVKLEAAGTDLLSQIFNYWNDGDCVPIFISEGTSEQKVKSIRSSYYLSTVYKEVLSSNRETLTIFGWGMGEHDMHIMRQMKGSGINRIAVSVCGQNQLYCHHALGMIERNFGPCKVDFFDSSSRGCWIQPND